MSKKSKRPTVLWANRINLSGLYSDKPIRCWKKAEYDDGKTYWDSSGDFDARTDQIGEHVSNEGWVVQFVSRSEKEVELWTKGVKAALAAVSRFCGK